MRRLDELHLEEHPFAGSRMLRDLLNREGVAVGRKHVATLRRRMGIEALYQRPRNGGRDRQHPVFPYLLRGMTIELEAFRKRKGARWQIGALTPPRRVCASPESRREGIGTAVRDRGLIPAPSSTSARK